MMDGALAWIGLYAGKYFVDGENPVPSKEMLTGQFACYNVYRTKDGRYMSLAALEPQFWSAFCKAMGKDDLVREQFSPGRRADEIVAEVESMFAKHTREEWIELLKDVDCCCESVALAIELGVYIYPLGK